MPTKLTKPVVREVTTRAGTDLVVTMAPEGLLIRDKGRRTTYGPIPYGILRIEGARVYVMDQKRRAAERRALRRAARPPNRKRGS